MTGQILKETEITKAKIFKGTAFQYKLSEGKRNSFKRKFEKNSNKAGAELILAVQKGMKKVSIDYANGDIFVEDTADLSAAVKAEVLRKGEIDAEDS